MARKNVVEQSVEQNQDVSLEVSKDYRGQFREAAAAILEATHVPGGPSHKTPEEQKQFKDPIAQNHEKLQNAGLEDAAAANAARAMSASTSTKSGTSTSTGSSSKDQQAFEDQRVGEGLSGGKKRKAKGRSTHIPDSIRALVDLLESSLSEAQVQEVLEKAIEVRSKGSALEISKNELTETTKAIFEEIRNSLANGDLSESSRERIEEEIARLFVSQSELVLDGEEGQWLAQKRQEHRQASVGDGAPFLADPELYDLSTEVAHLVHDYILNAPEGVSVGAQLTGIIASYSSRGLTGTLSSVEQYGLENVITSFEAAIHRVDGEVVPTEQARKCARAALLCIVGEELEGATLQAVREALILEIQENQSVAFEDLIAKSQFRGVLENESELFMIAEDVYKHQKDELRSLVVQELQELEVKMKRLTELTARTPESEKEIFSLLLELNRDGIEFLDEALQEEHGVTLEAHLASIIGEDGAKILRAGLKEDFAVYRAALAARYEEYTTDASGTVTLGIASKEQCDHFVDRLALDDDRAIKAYEVLFGDVLSPLETFSRGDRTRYHRAELALLRDGDEALKYAIEFSHYLDSQKGVIRNDPSQITIEYAEELRKVPAELRQDILNHLDQTLGTNAVQSLLGSPQVKDSGAALYLLGVIEDDSAKQLAGKLRLAEQDIYCTFLEILAPAHLALQEGIVSQVASHYREGFHKKFTLERDHTTQIWLSKREDACTVPEEVRSARIRLYESVSQEREIDPKDVTTVVLHEARLLGSEAARSHLSRGRLSENMVEFFQREQHELITSAEVFGVDTALLKRIVTLGYMEAFEEAKLTQLGNTIWEQGRLDRVTVQGLGELTKQQREQNLKKIQDLIEKQGIHRESPQFQALLDRYEESYKHYDTVYSTMKEAAQHLLSISSDDEMIQFMSRDPNMTEDEFEQMTDNRKAQRSWGYNRVELEILDTILKQAHGREGGAGGASSIAKDEFWTTAWKARAGYALDPQYAPDEPTIPPLTLGNSYNSDSINLVEQLSASDHITESALTLKLIVSKPDSLFELIAFAKEHGENLPQVIQRTEEVFGVSVSQLFPESGNLRVTEGGASSSTLCLNDVLQEILQSRGDIAVELESKIKLFADAHLDGLARREALERVGSVESRGLMEKARIRHGNTYRADDIRKERDIYIEKYGILFGEQKAALLTKKATQALREHVITDVLNNCVVLDRLEVIYDRTNIKGHRKSQYSVSKILEDIFSSEEALAWEERINQKRVDLKEEFLNDNKEIWNTAQTAVYEIYEAMKGGFFGWGTEEETIRKILRSLSPEERAFAIELYKLRYDETMLNHFKGEMEGIDLERVLACYRGDFSLDDQYAIEEAVDSWFGTDEKVLNAVDETLLNLEERTRNELLEEANRLSKEAERLRVSGGEEGRAEAARLSLQAFQYERAAKEELRESTLLQEKVGERLEQFWKECENKTGLGYEGLLSRIDNADQIREIVLDIHDPDTVVAQKIEAAIKNKNVEEAATLLQKERDRHRADTLRLRLEFDSEGRIQHSIGANGEIIIDGEEITAEHLRQFQEFQLTVAEQSLIGMLESGDLTAEQFAIVSQELKQVQAAIKEVQQMPPEEFLVEYTQEGEGLASMLSRMLTDESTGAPSALLVSQFENFYTQAVLDPKYQYSQRLIEGTLFAEDSPLLAKWQAQLLELEERLSDSEHSFAEQIELHVRKPIDKKHLLAEVSGDLDQIAATKLAKAVTEGDEEVITDVLFPPELTRIVAERKRVIAWYESQESLTEGQSNELQNLRDATDQILQNHVERVERRYAELSPSLPYYARDMWRGIGMRLGRATTELYRSALEKGEFSDALKLKIAMDGAGTTESLLFEGLGDPGHGMPQKSAAEIIALAEEYCALEGREDLKGKKAVHFLKERIHGELSGEEEWQADLLLVGVPETVAQMAEILNIHAKFEDSALLQFGAAWDRFEESKKAFDDILKNVTRAELQGMSEEELRTRLGGDRYQELFVHYEAASGSADIGNMERRAIADLTVNVVSTVGVVAGGVLITVGTGGLGTVGYLAVVGGSLVTVRTGLSYAMKGNSYSGSEALMDTGMAVVDTASLGAGVLISKGVSKVTTSIVNRMAARQATRSAVTGAQRTGLRLVTEASEEVVEQTTQKGLLSKAGGLALNTTKATGRGIAKTSVIAGEGAIDGAADGLLVGMYMQAMQDGNWQNGVFSGFSNMLSAGGQMARTGALIGVFAAPTFVGGLTVGGKAFKKVRGKMKSPEGDIATHVDQVRSVREEVVTKAEQQLQSRNSGTSPDSDVSRHLSDNVNDGAPINFQEAKQRLTGGAPQGVKPETVDVGDALEREIHDSWKRADEVAVTKSVDEPVAPRGESATRVTDETIEDFYRKLDGESPQGVKPETVSTGDALEKEIHESWNRVDGDDFGEGGSTISRPKGPSDSGSTGGGSRQSSRGDSTFTDSGRTGPSLRQPPGAPSGDGPQSVLAKIEQGGVAVMEPPTQVKQDVDFAPEGVEKAIKDLEDHLDAAHEMTTKKAEQPLQSRNSDVSPDSDMRRPFSDNADDLPPIYSFSDAQKRLSETPPSPTDYSGGSGRGGNSTSASSGSSSSAVIPQQQVRGGDAPHSVRATLESGGASNSSRQSVQDIQQIREDAQRFFSTESSARQVEASPQPTPTVDGPELLLVRPPEVEVSPHVRPLETPQPVRAPEVNPEVQPSLPRQSPHVRPTEVPQPQRTPDLTPNVKPEVGPLQRLKEDPNAEGIPTARQHSEASPHIRPHAQPRIKPRTRARARPRVRPGQGGGSDSILLDIPYGLEWVEGERFVVLSSPLLHQYRNPVNIFLRKKNIEKVKTYFGEVEVLKWSLPIY